MAGFENFALMLTKILLMGITVTRIYDLSSSIIMAFFGIIFFDLLTNLVVFIINISKIYDANPDVMHKEIIEFEESPTFKQHTVIVWGIITCLVIIAG